MGKHPKVLLVEVVGAAVDEKGELINPDEVKFRQTLVGLQELSPNERASVKRALDSEDQNVVYYAK